jgi:hypothetical protein
VEDDFLHRSAEAVVSSQPRQVFIAVRLPDEPVEARSSLIADRSKESVRLRPPRAQMAVQEAPDEPITGVIVFRSVFAPTVEIFSRRICGIFGGHLAPPAEFESG